MSNDELENIDEDDLAGFDEDFETGEGVSLGDMWRHSPLMKVGVVVAAFIAIVGGLVLFGGKKEEQKQSVAASGSDVKGKVGQGQMTEQMKKEMQDYNINQIEEAIQKGGSALPVPITPPRGGVLVDDTETTADDPLERWRKIQEERQKRAAQQEAPDLPKVDPNAETIDALAQAMLSQMQGLTENMPEPQTKFKIVTSDDYLNQQNADDVQASSDTAQQDDGQAAEQKPLKVIVPAGTIAYGQLMIEANSDAPGPVLAMIAGGPLSGDRLLGEFTVEDQGFLVIEFKTLVRNGLSQDIQAVAINPSTTTTGMVTEYNGRYFKRVLLPAAAEFISGFAEAVANSGTTNVSVSGDTVVQNDLPQDTKQEAYAGLQKGADEVSDFMKDAADNTEPLVKVAAGTPIGILFTTPVTEEDDTAATAP